MVGSDGEEEFDEAEAVQTCNSSPNPQLKAYENPETKRPKSLGFRV